MNFREILVVFMAVLYSTVFPATGQSTNMPVSPTDSLVVMTYNIRFDNPTDGQHAWANRSNEVFNLLREVRPGILGLQEALHNQITEIHQIIPHMQWYGVGRDDGLFDGEFSPIFYDTLLFSLKDAGTFWLSETPNRPGSMGWDAACPRVLTWVILAPRTGGQQFFVMNTHFDHIGETARRKSAEMAIALAEQKIAEGFRLIFMGDFNTEPSSEVFRIIASGHKLTEAGSLALKPDIGDGCTFTGFDLTACLRLDYIWVSENFKVKAYKILSNHLGRVILSDHKAVLAIIEENRSE